MEVHAKPKGGGGNNTWQEKKWVDSHFFIFIFIFVVSQPHPPSSILFGSEDLSSKSVQSYVMMSAIHVMMSAIHVMR